MPRGYDRYDEARLQQRLWTPEELRPVAWYDASDLSTLTLGASGITAWRDKLGRSALTLTSSSFPGLASVNAPAVSWTPLPVVVFNGAGHLMTGPSTNNYTNNTTGYSSMAAVRVTSVAGWTGGGDGAPMVWTDSDGWHGMGARLSSGRFQAGFYLFNNTDRSLWADFTSSTSPEAGIIFVEYASPSSYTTATNMGAAIATGSPTNPQGGGNTAAYRMGASYNNRFLGMELGELLHFGFALSPAQRAKVEGYLAWKWSLQPRLTAGVPTHRYAGLPPLIGD